MDLDQGFKKEISKIDKLKKVYSNLFLTLWIWFIIAGLAVGVFIGLAYGTHTINLPDGIIIAIVVLIILLGFAIPIFNLFHNPYRKYQTELIRQLVDSGADAATVLEFGYRHNIDDIYSHALKLRLAELNTTVIPEWCVRDGVLPTMEDIEKYKQK